MLYTFFSYALFSALVSFALTPVVIVLAKKFGLVDDSKIRPHPAHTHSGIIPRAGGLAIFLGIFLPLSLLIIPNKQIIGIFLGSLLLVVVGLWDDKRDRSPYVRLLINGLAAIIVISMGVGIPYITNPFGGVIQLDTWKTSFDFLGHHSIVIWANLLAFIWILWTTNIVGWSGGVDGQLPGFVAISAITIGLLSLRYINDPNQHFVIALSFLTAGSFIGFLPWNYYPQKIMPGYGGKTLAGFMLAVLSILSFSKLGTALLVLVVPMTDAGFILLKRLFSGSSPVKATSGHLHHHLLKLGWGKRKVALFYWLISATAGVAALSLNPKQKVFATILLLTWIAAFIVWLNFIRRFPITDD